MERTSWLVRLEALRGLLHGTCSIVYRLPHRCDTRVGLRTPARAYLLVVSVLLLGVSDGRATFLVSEASTSADASIAAAADAIVYRGVNISAMFRIR